MKNPSLVPDFEIWPRGEDGNPVNRMAKKSDIGIDNKGNTYYFTNDGWRPLTENDEAYNALFPFAESVNTRLSAVVNHVTINKVKPAT